MRWGSLNILVVLFINININTISYVYADYHPLTKPVLLMGDSQEHERHGSFTFVAGNWVDSQAKVAARSPQQDFYTKYAMADILKKHLPLNNKKVEKPYDAELAIHLGDFLDISCESEWKRLTLNEVGIIEYIKNGSMVLGVGNHDGFYVGNYAFDDMVKHPWVGGESWRDRCDAGKNSNYGDTSQNILHKGKLVEHIVNLLEGTVAVGKVKCYQDMICGSKKVTKNWTIHYQYPKFNKSDGDLSVANQGKYWRSYLVSEVTLTSEKGVSADVRMILMDLSQANEPVESFWNTALSFLPLTNVDIITGNIQVEQKNLVERLLYAPCESSIKHCLRILAGHHPLKDYGDNTLSWIKDMITRRKDSNPRLVNLYVSAHTHTGYIDETKGINEINVGALIENDPHYRKFWISQEINQNNNSVNYIAHSPLYLLNEEPNLNCRSWANLNGWKYLDDFPQGYTSFWNFFTKNQYIDKYAYLEQSRVEYKQAIEQIEHAKNTGTPEAIELWEGKLATPLDIYDGMSKWNSEQEKKIQKDPKSNEFNPKESCKGFDQAKYFDKSNYESIQKILNLLNTMKVVTTNFKNNSNYNTCKGKNSDDEYYLAYTETHFLGFLQDWLETIDTKAFIIKGYENEPNYRVCSARLAASKSKQKQELRSSAKRDWIRL